MNYTTEQMNYGGIEENYVGVDFDSTNKTKLTIFGGYDENGFLDDEPHHDFAYFQTFDSQEKALTKIAELVEAFESKMETFDVMTKRSVSKLECTEFIIHEYDYIYGQIENLVDSLK